jgi:ABC-2 type transport system ATP-binding protein
VTQPAPETLPLLVLERLHAVDEDGPRRRSRGRLHGVDLILGPGVHAVLGAPEDGTVALSEAATGMRAPLRGRVRVRGLDPSRHAPLRARIGSLAPTPSLLPAATVGEQIRMAMRARGEPDERFDGVLDPLGLAALHARRPRSLSNAEARAVELALALSTPAPLLVVLHEPFVDVAIPHTGLVRERVVELAEAGVCVLLVTSSPADARSLADDIHLLHHGLLVGAPGDADLPAGQVGEVVAWLREPPLGAGPGVRELAAALAAQPNLRAIAWDDTSPATDHRTSTLRLRGDVDACALALAEAAVDVGVVIDAISCSAPGLTQIRAARELGLKNLQPHPRGPDHPASPPQSLFARRAPASASASASAPAPAPAPAPASASAPAPAPAPAPASAPEPVPDLGSGSAPASGTAPQRFGGES